MRNFCCTNAFRSIHVDYSIVTNSSLRVKHVKLWRSMSSFTPPANDMNGWKFHPIRPGSTQIGSNLFQRHFLFELPNGRTSWGSQHSETAVAVETRRTMGRKKKKGSECRHPLPGFDLFFGGEGMERVKNSEVRGQNLEIWHGQSWESSGLRYQFFFRKSSQKRDLPIYLQKILQFHAVF